MDSIDIEVLTKVNALAEKLSVPRHFFKATCEDPDPTTGSLTRELAFTSVSPGSWEKETQGGDVLMKTIREQCTGAQYDKPKSKGPFEIHKFHITHVGWFLETLDEAIQKARAVRSHPGPRSAKAAASGHSDRSPAG